MNNYIQHIYASWTKDEKTRFESTSGGLFFEFSKIIIENGGVVFGAKYDANNRIVHNKATTIEELAELRQSKYASSSMGNCFKEVVQELNAGKQVGFCGTPCQVAGLASFLGKDYDNLFLMDFICRGVNSPKAYEAWLNEIEQNEKSKITRVWFKYKEGGWKSSPRRVRLDFQNGASKVIEGQDNLYMEGYLSYNLYMRPCCGSCQFKGMNRCSDVTFADFWKVEMEYDDDKGTSLLLINSLKGMQKLQSISDSIFLYEQKEDSISQGNQYLFRSVTLSPKTHNFLQELDKQLFSKAIKKYTKKSLKEKCISIIRKYIGKKA